MASGYYPAGADNSNAPWNQRDPDPIEIEVSVSYTIKKDTVVADYECVVDTTVDYERDEDGRIVRTGGTTVDYSNCDLEKDFAEQHISPLILLKEYSDILTDKLRALEAEYRESDGRRDYSILRKIEELKEKIECCEGWSFEEIYIERI